MAILYELTSDFQYLLSLAEDPETDPEVLADTLEGLQGDIEAKLENYVICIKELESQVSKFDTEIKRLTKVKNYLSGNIDNMKARSMDAMRIVGKDKLQTEHFKLSIAKNGGKLPMKVTADVLDIPQEYVLLKSEPNNDKIREALEAGEELGFAHLEERGVHLNIR